MKSKPPANSSPHYVWDQAHVRKIIDDLQAIRRDMLELEGRCAPSLDGLNDACRKSGANLLHYLALRRRDIRAIQDRLSALGLSSLGRAEAHVMASVDAVLHVLHSLANLPPDDHETATISFTDGKSLLTQHTEALLGPKPGQRQVRIMVTMPSEAADDYLLVRELLGSGMDCMRINCAHDGPEEWGRMITNLRRAKREQGKKCRILMDLGGPKLRTGPVKSEAQVIKWRPRRDRLGMVLEPARIWLLPEGGNDLPEAPADAVVPMPEAWLLRLRSGDVVRFRDARGANRAIRIVGEAGRCRWAESDKTSYVVTGTVMCRVSPDKPEKKSKRCGDNEAKVGDLPPEEGMILLKRGDYLHLTRDVCPGTGARYDVRGKLLSPATISCTLPEVFDQVHPGERIWLDDGKIGGIIRAVGRGLIKVEITHAGAQGEKLRAEKGINLPDSALSLPALTGKDISDLGFIARHAHMVGMSFVQNVDDIVRLRELVAELGAPDLGIVLKIETRRGFEMLPDLLLASMRSHAVGVMIARGDLAVECGYERLAEVQEEILWLSEAAHVPVIWATQVLESLAKSGVPSRAEITDAAMGERAECVMLNKGPHIIEAMKALDNILQRMEAHQQKKSPMLRQLRWWEKAQTHCVLTSPPKT